MAQNLADLSRLIRGKTASRAVVVSRLPDERGIPGYAVTADGKTTDLRLTNSVWSPKTCRPLGSAILPAAFSLAASPACSLRIFPARPRKSTDTFDQYSVVRNISEDPRMDFIFWDGAAYRTAGGDLPSRRFGVTMEDYRP